MTNKTKNKYKIEKKNDINLNILVLLPTKFHYAQR